MKKLLFSTLLLLLLCPINQLEAADNIGPKALGMGGAFTAIADDLSCLYWNPAGLADLCYLGAVYSEGISSTYVGDIQNEFNFLDNLGDIHGIGDYYEPNYYHARGTGFMGGAIGDLGFSLIGHEETYLNAATHKEIDYTELSYNLSIASETYNLLFLPHLAMGVNAKFVEGTTLQFTYPNEGISDSPDMIKNSSIVKLDVGFLAKMNRVMNLALVLRDVPLFTNNPELTNSQSSVTFGYALKNPGLVDSAACDIEYVFSSTDITGVTHPAYEIIHVGFEKKLFAKLISVRAGFYAPLQLTNLSFKENPTYTGGIGIDFRVIRFEMSGGTTRNMDKMQIMWVAEINI